MMRLNARAQAARLLGAYAQGQRAFWHWDLQGVDLHNACLVSIDLRGACLRQANLRGAKLDGAILAGADLT
jgi:uncharacterized protein YjbI with pentapeptide repeats